VCTENLNPDVMVMKSAKNRVRIDRSDPLNRAIDRRIFVQCNVRFGSLADIAACPSDVCFTPESGH